MPAGKYSVAVWYTSTVSHNSLLPRNNFNYYQKDFFILAVGLAWYQVLEKTIPKFVWYLITHSIMFTTDLITSLVLGNKTFFSQTACIILQLNSSVKSSIVILLWAFRWDEFLVQRLFKIVFITVTGEYTYQISKFYST